MGTVIGELLPLAVGIAISPIPIIAAILMLLSPRAKSTGTGFLLGWVLGIAAVASVFALLAGVIPPTDPGTPNPTAAIIKLVLGALLLLLAIRQWRGRPKPGQAASLPKWMAAIDSFTFAKALGLGFLLSALNPKNLLFGVAAGVDVGNGDLNLSESAIAIAVFTVFAALSVAIPVIAYLSASNAMAKPLDRLREWLVQNNSTVMAVLLLVMGVVIVGKGIAQF